MILFAVLSAINYMRYDSRLRALNAAPRDDVSGLVNAIAPGAKPEDKRAAGDRFLYDEIVIVVVTGFALRVAIRRAGRRPA